MRTTILLLLLPLFTSAILIGTAGKNQSPSVLYEIDPDTGVGTALGTVRVNGVGVTLNDVAYDTTNNLLYGITSTTSPNLPDTILTIRRDGRAGVVGTTGIPEIRALTVDRNQDVYGFTDTTLVKIDRSNGSARAFMEDTSVDVVAVGLGSDGSVSELTAVLQTADDRETQVYQISTATGASTFQRVLDAAFDHRNGDLRGDTFWVVEDAGDGDVNTRIQKLNLAVDATGGDILQTNINDLVGLTFTEPLPEDPMDVPVDECTANPCETLFGAEGTRYVMDFFVCWDYCVAPGLEWFVSLFMSCGSC